MRIGAARHRPGHTPRACFARHAPLSLKRKGQSRWMDVRPLDSRLRGNDGGGREGDAGLIYMDGQDGQDG